MLLWLWLVAQGTSAPAPPPEVPFNLTTAGPPCPPGYPPMDPCTALEPPLSLQWTQDGWSRQEVEKYAYRAYIEGQKEGVFLTVGCEGPETGPGPFFCGSTPPPLVKSPGVYRVMVSAARSSSEPESEKSASAPWNIRYPATASPAIVVIK